MKKHSYICGGAHSCKAFLSPLKGNLRGSYIGWVIQCTLHMQQNWILSLWFLPFSGIISTVKNTPYFMEKYPSFSNKNVLFLCDTFFPKWSELRAWFKTDQELERALGGRAAFLLPSETSLPHDSHSLDSWCLKGEMWTCGVIALSLYLATLWWSRVLHQTLPAPSKAVHKFCSAATRVQAGIRICICETAATLRPVDTRGKNHEYNMCPQKTLHHELHQFPDWGGSTLLCGLFWLIPFRHGRWDKFTAAMRNPVICILRKRTLCNSRIEHSWINTGSVTLFMHRLSVISSSGFSVKETPCGYLMSEAWERNKDFNLSEINIVIASLQIPHEIMVIRFHFSLKTACCICSVLVYLITVQNKAL